MKERILDLLRGNARLSNAEIARRLNLAQADVEEAISALERQGVIRGYTAIIDDTALHDNAVRALIEVRVTPQREGGFDQVAQRIAKFPEVTDVILVSGTYDLLLTVEGDSLQTVANFVAAKLATIEGVISTSTGFRLKKYKESGKIMQRDEKYERLKIVP